ncbi:YesL family protein [Lysinibacillus piscis]|uniref:DUF624 domain-containing protein n=1 Tax=Lysinibacillus piscis TaxID=2518931 RepID=A0ABQ5NMS9_9BACI|nr:DUF624 domain-containing protein [Lysinibacillus sp. KH24]GLC89655.1 hypothetical protein LYSBPC_27820 [Lysinibacillus sp. KH24]
MFQPSSWYMRLGTWLFNLVWLHILWVIFTLLGLVIFGLFPATAAMFAVLRQLIMEEDDSSVTKLFFEKYKAEFVGSTLWGLLLSGGVVLLYVNMHALSYLQLGVIRTLLASSTVVIGFVYLCMLLNFFPVFVHLRLLFWQYPKYALLLAVAKPIQTIFMIIIVIVLAYLYLMFPILVVLFGISLFAYALMYIALRSLPREQLVEDD